jgi:hypothetical protein
MNDNKLIAEFMGFQKTDIGWYESNDEWFIGLSNSGNTFDEYELSFDTSWDWLMPVVEKCYHNGADENNIGDITHALLDCNIDNTYQAVVEFIKEKSNEL